MFAILLLALLNVTICLANNNPENSNDSTGEFGYGWNKIEQGWDNLVFQEVKETYLEFVDAMAVVVDKSCLLCIATAAATSEKDVNWRMMETIFEEEDKKFLDHYGPIIVRIFLISLCTFGFPSFL